VIQAVLVFDEPQSGLQLVRGDMRAQLAQLAQDGIPATRDESLARRQRRQWAARRGGPGWRFAALEQVAAHRRASIWDWSWRHLPPGEPGTGEEVEGDEDEEAHSMILRARRTRGTD
jgi:hypothetical protein